MPSNEASSARRTTLLAIVLIVAGTLAYTPSFQVPFLLDDFASIPDNPTIRDLGAPRAVLAPPPNTTVEGRPVLNLTLALDWARGGEALFGYHLTNLVVHLGAGLLLFGLLRRTLREVGAPLAISASVAALWILHPLQTQSVTYIIQRAEALMGFLLLATLYASARSFRSQHPRRWRLVAVLACALGMGVKEVMVVTPVLVLVYDRTFVSASFAEAWRRHRALHLGLAATWLLLAASVLVSPRAGSVSLEYAHLTPLDYALTQLGVLAYYLRKSLVPTGLVFDLDWPIATGPGDVLLPGLLVAALAAATVVLLIRRRGAGFVGLAFFAILAPSSSFLPIATEIAALHRMYLPLAAVLTFFLCVLHGILRRGLGEPGGTRALCTIAVVLALAAGLSTYRRNELMGDPLALWRDVVAREPQSPRAHNQVGLLLLQAGDAVGAREYCSRALALGKPYEQYPAVHFNLGSALLETGDAQAAAEQFARTLAITPDDLKARTNLGAALVQLGRDAEAAEQLELCLARDPAHVSARRNLAAAHFFQGHHAEAARHWRLALEVAPDDVLLCEFLSQALAGSGDYDEAIAVGERALALARAQGLRDAVARIEHRLELARERRRDF